MDRRSASSACVSGANGCFNNAGAMEPGCSNALSSAGSSDARGAGTSAPGSPALASARLADTSGSADGGAMNSSPVASAVAGTGISSTPASGIASADIGSPASAGNDTSATTGSPASSDNATTGTSQSAGNAVALSAALSAGKGTHSSATADSAISTTGFCSAAGMVSAATVERGRPAVATTCATNASIAASSPCGSAKFAVLSPANAIAGSAVAGAASAAVARSAVRSGSTMWSITRCDAWLGLGSSPAVCATCTAGTTWSISAWSRLVSKSLAWLSFGPSAGISAGAASVFVHTQDIEHGVDAAFEIAHHLDHFADALAGQVLERAGEIDVGRAAVDLVAGRPVDALFAQRPGGLLDLLGGGENVGGCLLGRLHDRVRVPRSPCRSCPECSWSGLIAAISRLVRAIALAISRMSKRMRSNEGFSRSPRSIDSSRSMAASTRRVSDWRLRRAELGQEPAAADRLHHRRENGLVIRFGGRWGRRCGGGRKGKLLVGHGQTTTSLLGMRTKTMSTMAQWPNPQE